MKVSQEPRGPTIYVSVKYENILYTYVMQDAENRVTYFAVTDNRTKQTPFGIKKKDRRHHMYVIGKTGVGKSTLLENIAIQDIQNGEGLAFIDPHGSSAEKLLQYVPEHRIQDVLYFAPFDLDYPIGFNVLEGVTYEKRQLIVSGLMATFRKTWGDDWSGPVEHILGNTLLALLEYPNATLLAVNRMYSDADFRVRVVSHVKDPAVRDFWEKEYAMYVARDMQGIIPTIQNKVGQFINNPLMRNIIGQPHSHFDIRKMMDEKKIIIANLSKGLMGEENMRILGSMLTTHISLAAMSRADQSAEDLQKLPDFFFVLDEFQNFANDTFADILSESRKYKLGLTIAHQFGEQMEEKVRGSVYGNVGTIISFRVGPFDARLLEFIFSRAFKQEDLAHLNFAQICLSLMIDGVGSFPFSATTLPPIEPPTRHFKDKVIEASRARFGRARADVEAYIQDTYANTSQKSFEGAPSGVPEEDFERGSVDTNFEGTPTQAYSSQSVQGSFEVPEEVLRAALKEK